MKEILKNNWWLKLIALAFSILLWLTITNTTDPEGTYQITDIPIQFLNEDSIYDSGMTYYVEGADTTAVEVNLRKSQLKNVSASDFKATVDLSKRYGQTGYVEIDIEVVNNKKLLEGKYKQLTYAIFIRTEEVKTKTFTIEPVVEGNVAEGYDYNDISVEPKRVEITAPESLLENISRVVAPVRLEGNTENVETTSTLVLYNADGKVINLENETEINLSFTEARVYIPVLKVNTIPVIVQISGENDVAAGYRYISYECDVQNVAVSGEKSVIDGITSIVISGDAVNVTGADGDKNVTVDINDYLPDGVYVSGDDSSVNIVIKVEKLVQKEFSISYGDVAINGKHDGFEYTITGSGAVPVIVSGLAADLDSLSADDIKLSLDVSGYGQGEYLIAVSARRINNFDINVPNPVVVRITAVGNNGGEDESSSEHIPQTSISTPVESEPQDTVEHSTEAPSGES